MMKRYAIQLLALLVLSLAIGTPSANAASKIEIDAKVKSTLSIFYQEVRSGKELTRKAKGILVFPEVLKGGIGIGGEYGEGALLIKGKTAGYYNTAAASIGFQLGGQIKSQVILFMTDEALKNFRNSSGWKAGVDGSIAIASLGAGDSIDTETSKKPIIGFIFSNKGLMYNLTFEGSKITKMKR